MLLDLIVPNLDVEGFCRRIMALHPDIPVVVQTGGLLPNSDCEEFIVAMGFPVLFKPYEPDELVRFVNEANPQVFQTRIRAPDFR